MEPPDLISVPRLKVYTHIQVLNKITVRELAGDNLASAGPVKKSKVQPKARSQAAVAMPADDGDEDGEDEADNEEEAHDKADTPTHIVTPKKEKKPKAQTKAQSLKSKSDNQSPSSAPRAKRARN